MTGEKFIIYIGVAIVILLEAIYIYLQDSIGPIDANVAIVNNKIAMYKKENMQLKDQYLQQASLTTILVEAHAMGFVPATYIYLK